MWILVRGLTAYKMEGAFAVESKAIEKRPDGTLVLKLWDSPNISINDHAPVPPNKPKDRLVKVPYWKQTDNYRDANRTCFSSSMAMIIEFIKPDELPDDDTYVQTVFSIGDTTNPDVQLQALGQHGIQGTYSQTLGFDDLDDELSKGYPVGIAILHRGPLDAPTGGHWIVCTGVSNDGLSYRFNDPYGSLMDGYQGAVENGKDVWYSREILEHRWLCEGSKSGWGMKVRKI